MPFVRISLRSDTSAETRRHISTAIHEALVASIGIPAGELFHLITALPAADMIYNPTYDGVDYQNIVFIEIVLIRGRSEDKKLRLYRAINDNLVHNAGLRPEDVVIILTENDRVDWSMAHGQAQLLHAPPRT